jgi:hypothetical protein
MRSACVGSKLTRFDSISRGVVRVEAGFAASMEERVLLEEGKAEMV